MRIIAISIALSVLILLIITINVPLNIENKEGEVTLKWLGLKNNYVLYIDDNKEFSSPIITEVNRRSYSLNLNPGTYYWKLDNNHPSKFTINSLVSIKRAEEKIVNDGNIPIRLTASGFTGFAILDSKESKKVGELANVTAEES